MARDPKLLRRNLLVLPGGLLTLYAVAGLLYVAAYRTPTPACGVAHRFLVASHCYSAYASLALILIVGLALVVVGLVVFRGAPRELPGHLHPGTPTHFVLALLASLVVVPALVWVVLWYVEASQGLSPFITSIEQVPFQTKFLFLLVAVAGVLAFVPYLGLCLGQARLRRRFLRKVEEVAANEAPGFPGEEPRPAEPLVPPPEEFVDDGLWPDSRDTPVPAAPDAGTVTLASAPAALAAAPVVATASPVAPLPAARADSPVLALPQAQAQAPAQAHASAPVVAVHPGCRAILPSGLECGRSVGPAGKYCLSHACQGTTASGAACRSSAKEGTLYCPAHAT